MADESQIQDPAAELAAEQTAAEAAAAAEAANTKTVSQAELDRILAERLGAEREKARGERMQWEAEVQKRDAYIRGLQEESQRAISRSPAQDPYAGLTPEEKFLRNAVKSVTGDLEKRLESQNQQTQATLAYLTAKDTMDDYCASKGKVPEEVKARAMQLYRGNIMNGATPEGAFKMAAAEHAERMFNGTSSNFEPDPKTQQTRSAATAPKPHVEIGSSRRSFTAPGAKDPNAKDYKKIAKESGDPTKTSLRAFFDDATEAAGGDYAPSPADGGHGFPGGAGPASGLTPWNTQGRR